MRTLGFRSNLLVALAAAIGVIAALDRPWYAATAAVPDEVPGPVERLSAAVARWATEGSGTSGWEALGDWAPALAALAALTAAGAAGCLVPALQGVAREALRYGGLALFVLAAWKLLDSPGPNAALELRQGAFVAAFAALVAVIAASAAASAPLRRRR